MDNINSILKEKNNCNTLKEFLNNNDKISNKDLPTFIKIFFIILLDDRVQYLEEKDINKFIEIIDKNYIPDLIGHFRIFIKKDSYDLKVRPLKNLLYKYMIEKYYLNQGIEDFIFDDKISAKRKNIFIEKQKLYFNIVKNTGMVQPLYKINFFNRMARCFHKSIAQDIKNYTDLYEKNMNKKYKDIDFIWKCSDLDHDIMKLESGLEIIKETRKFLINDVSEFFNKSESIQYHSILKSINDNGEEINPERAYIKKDLLIKYSTIVNNKLSKEKLNEIALIEKLFSKKEGYFFNKIIKFLNLDMLYDALKESIIFLESTLRDILTDLNNEILEYDMGSAEERKENFIQFIKHLEKQQQIWKDDDILIDTLYLTHTYNYFIDHFSWGNIKVKNNLMNTLLNNSLHENLLTKEDIFFLKYLLLKDNGEGLNLRNEIFHGFKNELYFYETEVKENYEMIFKLTIFYILSCIIKMKGH